MWWAESLDRVHTAADKQKVKKQTMCEMGENRFYLIRSQSIDRVKKTDWFSLLWLAFRDKLKSSLNKWTDRWNEDKTIFMKIYDLLSSPVGAFLLTIMESSDIRYTLRSIHDMNATWILCNHIKRKNRRKFDRNVKSELNLSQKSRQPLKCTYYAIAIIHAFICSEARSYVSSSLVSKTQ